MHSPLAFIDLHSLMALHRAFLPVAGGACLGIAFSLFRGGRFSASEDRASIMHLAALGSLRCICGADTRDGAMKDRRQFCRSCGCEIVAANRELLDKQLSSREIKAMTRSLRRAAIRASYLELPPSVTSIDELHRYLASVEPKRYRIEETAQPVPVERTQVH
jgi:hypothetical protein